MKKLLFTLSVSLFALASCGGPNPTDFNNAITKAHDAATKSQIQFDEKLVEVEGLNNYAALQSEVDSTLANINTQLEKLNSLETPKGGEAYKEAAIKNIECVKSIVEVGGKFAQFTDKTAKSEFTALKKEYEDKIEKYSSSFDELEKTQAEFAKAVGYQVR